MKKTVLTFGLLAGAIMALMMVIPPMIDKDFSWGTYGEIVGYATMVLAFIMVFVGTRQYRDNYNGGLITFGRAFKVAILITLISTVVYVIVWMILSETVYQDFWDRYSAMMMEKAKSSGLTPEKLSEKQAEMDKYREMYKNPLFRAAFTFIEPLPVGLLFSLVTAFIVKKKQ